MPKQYFYLNIVEFSTFKEKASYSLLQLMHKGKCVTLYNIWEMLTIHSLYYFSVVFQSLEKHSKCGALEMNGQNQGPEIGYKNREKAPFPLKTRILISTQERSPPSDIAAILPSPTQGLPYPTFIGTHFFYCTDRLYFITMAHSILA